MASRAPGPRSAWPSGQAARARATPRPWWSSGTAPRGLGSRLPANPSVDSTVLNTVSCTTATWCVAAGYSLNGSSDRNAVAETWNGGGWSLSAPHRTDRRALSRSSTASTASPRHGAWRAATTRTPAATSSRSPCCGTARPGASSRAPTRGNGTSGFFNSVSCAGTQFCVAAGYYYNGTVFQAELATMERIDVEQRDRSRGQSEHVQLPRRRGVPQRHLLQRGRGAPVTPRRPPSP